MCLRLFARRRLPRTAPGYVGAQCGWSTGDPVVAWTRRRPAYSGSAWPAIEGTVTDPDDAAVVGALVIVVSTGTGYDRSTYTYSCCAAFDRGHARSTYLIAVSARLRAHARGKACV